MIALTPESLPRWDTFIVREGHSVGMDGEGRILLDGNAATEYFVEQDYMFGMGDNRDNSLDCRFWGFIPKENIVGAPMIVYWSWDPDIPLLNLPSKLASIRFGRIGTIIH